MGYGVYHSRAGVVAGTLALQIISTTCIALRLYTRYWRQQAVLVSDWFVLAAFLCGSGLSVMEIYAVASHAFATPLNSTAHAVAGLNHRYLMAQHMEYAFVIIGVFAVGFIKLSVCLLYWHLFALVRFRRFLIVWITILVLWTIAFVLGELLECGTHPLAVFGTRNEIAKYCKHIHNIGYAIAGSDVATDLITLIIPLPLVFKMRLPMTRKILVLMTFLLGALAVGASTAKAYIYIAGSLALTNEDGIILITAYSMWNLVEVHVGVIAACGMTLRPLLAHAIPLNRFVQFIFSLGSSHTRKTPKDSAHVPSFVRMDSRMDSARRELDRNRKTDKTEQAYKGQDMTFQTSALPEVV